MAVKDSVKHAVKMLDVYTDCLFHLHNTQPNRVYFRTNLVDDGDRDPKHFQFKRAELDFDLVTLYLLTRVNRKDCLMYMFDLPKGIQAVVQPLFMRIGKTHEAKVDYKPLQGVSGIQFYGGDGSLFAISTANTKYMKKVETIL